MGNFQNDILSAHNEYRRKHGTGSLKWSSKLESKAQKWANQLAKKGYLQHEQQSEDGENIACLKGEELSGEKASAMWYDEIKDYNFNQQGFNSKTGHFTQLIWESSTELGVGKATASNGMQFVVARYFPPGNHIKKFADNVRPPGSFPSTNNNSNNNNRNNGNNNSSNNNRVSPRRNGNNGGGAATNKEGSQSNNEFKKNFLRSHNNYRKRHASHPLKWNTKLEEKAREAAEDAAKTNTLRSVDMSNVGQNMAAMTGGELMGDKVSSMWYEEEEGYNYNSPGFSSSTGSFTQLVWKESRDIGIGRAFGSKGQTFVIALYQPPGNIRGQYEQNVSRPSGPGPTDQKQGCKCAIL